MLSAVQNRPKNAIVPSASRKISLILPPLPALKFMEMMGCAACPTLYAQH